MPIWSRITLSCTDAVQDNTSVHILILLLALIHPLILNTSLEEQQDNFLFLLQQEKKKETKLAYYLCLQILEQFVISHYLKYFVICKKYLPSALYKS